MPGVEVIIDTDVLIALCKVESTDLLRDWPGARFLTTDVNIHELTKEDSLACVEAAIVGGFLIVVPLDEPSMLENFARLATRAGAGEAAMMVAAAARGAVGMSNDRGAGNVARSLVPSVQVISMEDLFGRCMEGGRLTPARLAELQARLRGEGEFVPFAKGMRAIAGPLPPLSA